MSAVSRFAAAMFPRSRAVIGGEPLTIGGGAAVSAVFAESEQSRDYDPGGYDRDQSLDAVVSISDWVGSYASPDSTYIGKPATARGLNWKVQSIRRGASFVTVRLGSNRKGA